MKAFYDEKWYSLIDDLYDIQQYHQYEEAKKKLKVM